MARILMKGNEAAVIGAILAGCRSFYGYPITPASEIAEAAARYLPLVGGTFLQAESEIAAINMVYGAAAAGERTMTASSGPGLSLMQEGISYLAGAELPAVIVDIMRGGPGLGNIAPEQSDYHQIVKGGGHGNYRTIVLAPNSVQEMCDLTMLAFELADRYRNPVIILTDGFIGQMMEPVELPRTLALPIEKPWAVQGTAETRQNLITSIHLSPEELEAHVRRLEEKYAHVARHVVMYEKHRVEDAEIITIGYGIISRVLKAAVEQARAEGLKVGLFRPITLWPFPAREISVMADWARCFLVVELSHGQLVEDVRLAVNGERPVKLYTRFGGIVPTAEELLEQIRKVSEEDDVRTSLREAEEYLWGV
ncbi:MAG: 3-methyl-2-oxobutanoate dehydrogenase subunit VorB [Blastocatellia bacterium]|nr:3-methyl-2-oxobutanoate dehydrogenase subunit VorB [Blastocatellia bacterium]MCS7156190.1 3-methyl-2-oxobutanoate dehydrogenase subunit VorB [Blastocatellia bacterium]MCX7751460.1 3-methyl-2-oxobutanoate dehydrogenase subunit VorB [Blastocatellia bacterium]MDW8169173.1 3-methyl-2-oxobutanoate dehydrogenase subunit VorB [Acidobacteriota bacterium]MDW8256034.1 3-methyl-2-oxobutanoate dehydrogenase subunit VorB [Acidobacteriota bacterium]